GPVRQACSVRTPRQLLYRILLPACCRLAQQYASPDARGSAPPFLSDYDHWSAGVTFAPPPNLAVHLSPDFHRFRGALAFMPFFLPQSPRWPSLPGKITSFDSHYCSFAARFLASSFLSIKSALFLQNTRGGCPPMPTPDPRVRK